MAIIIPDDVIVKSVRVFLSGERRNDKTASYALSIFLTQIENRTLSLDDAQQKLSHEKYISKFIEEIRLRETNKLEETLLQKIHANSEQTLGDIGVMHKNLSALMSQATEQLSTINSVAKNLEKTSDSLVAKVENLIVHARKTLDNTSNFNTGIMATGFLLLGTVCSLGTAYYYERHLSIAALSNKSLQASAPPPPKPVCALTIVPPDKLALGFNGKKRTVYISEGAVRHDKKHHPFKASSMHR